MGRVTKHLPIEPAVCPAPPEATSSPFSGGTGLGYVGPQLNTLALSWLRQAGAKLSFFPSTHSPHLDILDLTTLNVRQLQSCFPFLAFPRSLR